jgi:hypothetical protein
LLGLLALLGLLGLLGLLSLLGLLALLGLLQYRSSLGQEGSEGRPGRARRRRRATGSGYRRHSPSGLCGGKPAEIAQHAIMAYLQYHTLPCRLGCPFGRRGWLCT